MKKIEYTVSDESGIHARPAGLIVNCAKKYNSSISIQLGEKNANAKKLFEVMQLGAKRGDRVVIVASGDDEDDALSDMEAVLGKAGL